MLRTVAEWRGTGGLPGFTVMHWDDTLGPDGALSQMKITLTDLLGAGASGESVYLSDQITISFRTEVETIDPADGAMTSFAGATAQPPITGTQLTGYAGVAGACVSWYTGGVVRGRRVRGRTFLVPLALPAFGPDGTLSDSLMADLDIGGQGVVTAGTLLVWSRPTGPGATDGSAYPVTAYRATDQAAYLSSRRD